MRTRLASFAACLAVTMAASAVAGAPPLHLVAGDLDRITAGTAEVLRTVTSGDGVTGEVAAQGVADRGAAAAESRQPDRQLASLGVPSARMAGGAPADGMTSVAAPLRGVPGTVVTPSLANGIGGSDALVGPLGSQAALGSLFALEVREADRPPLGGTPGTDIPGLTLGGSTLQNGVGPVIPAPSGWSAITVEAAKVTGWRLEPLLATAGGRRAVP